MPIRTPALDLSTALPRLRAAIERAGRDPANLDQALAASDELMYSIKRSTKNNVIYQTWNKTARSGFADTA